jgi:hypothetical protein
VVDIQGASLVRAIHVKQFHAYPDDPTYEHSLLAECMSAIHWGSHVEVSKKQQNIYIYLLTARRPRVF